MDLGGGMSRKCLPSILVDSQVIRYHHLEAPPAVRQAKFLLVPKPPILPCFGSSDRFDPMLFPYLSGLATFLHVVCDLAEELCQPFLSKTKLEICFDGDGPGSLDVAKRLQQKCDGLQTWAQWFDVFAVVGSGAMIGGVLEQIVI